jgi:hypothetical protein
MADLIGHVMVGLPDMEAAEECPDCGFDTMLAFPLTVITEEGVGPFGSYRACARCYDERTPN